MEILLTHNPMLRSTVSKEISDYRTKLLNVASFFSIATGFISSESLIELRRLVDYRKGDIFVNLFVGMNYLEGFTELQYSTLRDLSFFLTDNQLGNVYVSPRALYHGKMYSFTNKEGDCLGSFIGSSNLGSFIGTSQNTIEADIFLPYQEGRVIDQRIQSVIKDLGTPFNEADPITSFLEPDTDLLKGIEYVKKLSDEEFESVMSSLTGQTVEIPLKTESKSNLNTYFGAGKVRDKFSPRSWYEVELIIPKKTPNIEILPDKDAGPFRVITSNKYSFYCERQGDYSKNFRSSKDLKILGKWIKGEMEKKGVIRCGEKVTDDTLRAFGKSKLVFKRSTGDFWYISLE